MNNVKTAKRTIEINSHKIKTRMFELGLTQDYLAQKIGLNFTTLNLKLNNKRPITLDEVAKLASALELKTFTEFIECFGLGFLNLSASRENENNNNIDAKGA